MNISDAKTVDQYAKHHISMVLMLERLQRFVANMQAPDEDGCVAVGYDYIGSVAHIAELLESATEIAKELENG